MIDDEIEPERSGPFVYQASLTFLQPCEDIVLVKAYNEKQAEEIIKESFKDVENLRIHHLTATNEQITTSVLKGIKH